MTRGQAFYLSPESSHYDMYFCYGWITESSSVMTTSQLFIAKPPNFDIVKTRFKNSKMNLNRTISSIKDRSLPLLKIFGFCFFCLYFSYQLITGQNGIVNYFKQKAKLERLEQQLSVVEEKTKKLEGKAQKLYPSSLDVDLLDEQYRRTTGQIKPDEKVYYYQN
jgi:cell division protein FtsB